MLTRVGDERLENVPQMEPVRRELLQDALRFYQRFLQKKGDDPVIRTQIALVHRRLANIHRWLDQLGESETEYRNAFAMFEELAAQSPLEPRTRWNLSWAHDELSGVLDDLERREDGEKHVRLAIQIAEDLMKEFPGQPGCANDLACFNMALARYIPPPKRDEAENLVRRSLTLANSPVTLAQGYYLLGQLMEGNGRYAEAEEAIYQAVHNREKVAAEDQASHTFQSELGNVLFLLSNMKAV